MKKKGFTLIELLAVIVVLAIIALIATPMVLNTIESAREGAATASANTYKNAVEEYVVRSQLDTTKPQLKAGVKYLVQDINDFITIKGDKPESGYVVISEAGIVKELNIFINNYTVTCLENKCDISDKEVSQAEYESMATYILEKVEEILANDVEISTYNYVTGSYYAGYNNGGTEFNAYMTVNKCTTSYYNCIDEENSIFEINETDAIPYQYAFELENGKIKNGDIIFEHYASTDNPAPVIFIKDGKISSVEMNYTK